MHTYKQVNHQLDYGFVPGARILHLKAEVRLSKV